MSVIIYGDLFLFVVYLMVLSLVMYLLFQCLAPCAKSYNGGCSQFCWTRSSTSRDCDCSLGLFLAGDSASCISRKTFYSTTVGRAFLRKPFPLLPSLLPRRQTHDLDFRHCFKWLRNGGAIVPFLLLPSPPFPSRPPFR